ncbi:MAG TPA: hypothetical protein VF815_31510 [Myxococcaceae bacterium]
MGRKKARLLTSDRYGLLVAAQRCAELLNVGDDECGPIELRLEDSPHSPWDDLTEVHRDENDKKRHHVWQIKRQREQIKREHLVALLKALYEAPGLVGHLAFYSLVDVPKVGSLVSLDELCERVKKPGFDPGAELELSTAEKKWVNFVQKLGCSFEEALALFSRLEVVELGQEKSLKRRAMQLLERHFTEPERAHDRLMAFLGENTDGAVRFTAALLEERAFKGVERRSSSRSGSAVELRGEYLDTVIESYKRLSPLRDFTGRGASGKNEPKLVDIFAMPALRAENQDERLLRIPAKPELQGNVIEPPDEEDEELRQSFDHLLFQPGMYRLVEQLLEPRHLAERPRYLLEGSVGAGKSTVLEHLRFKLAERAKEDPRAPLPIRLQARDLVSDLAQAVTLDSPPLDPRLLQSSSVGFVYLVDGLDEVEQHRGRTVQDRLDILSRQASTIAMIMAGRPSTSYVTVPSSTVRLRVVPWSRAQVDEFLDRWRQHDPERVDALRHLSRIDALLPVLTTPLTATFALLLAKEEPEALRSRAGLFRGIEERLFSTWARRRGIQKEGEVPSWEKIAPALRKLALESLKSGDEQLTRKDFRRHLRADALDELIEDAHRRFGLFVYLEDGSYRFLLRGIAEHLAGAALLEQGKEAILKAAHEKWAEEPVRHALGLGLDSKGGEWALEMLSALLPGPNGIRVVEVRPLLIAARAALDFGEEARPVAEKIAEALANLLTVETSTWIPQASTDVTREMARLGGPCWDALLRRLKARLSPRCEPAEWYLAQDKRSLGWWLEALKHVDPKVRCVAIERLGAWVDDLRVRDALLSLIADETYPPFDEPPALRAGLVLRKATRDEAFQEMLPELIGLAQDGGQFTGGAAALALRSTEAPAPLLAKCLHALSIAGKVYQEPLQELAALPEGETALNERWKNWRDADSQPETPPTSLTTSVGDTPPLSVGTLRNLYSALGPGIARWSPEQWNQMGLSPMSFELTRALCEAAWEHPEGILERLKHPGRFSLPLDIEFELGEAAVRHPALRAALLELWERNPSENERSLYPGGALSALVARGDEEAAAIYAQWLRVTVWLRMGFKHVFLSPAALLHPIVRPVAIERALDIWRQYKDGWLDKEGKLVFLSGLAMASIVGRLRPAWENITGLESEILQRARVGNEGTLTHALGVFSKSPYPEELAELVSERFDRFADQFQHRAPWDVAFWLSWAERAGITERVQNTLERMRTWNSWLRYQATSVLLPLRVSNAADLSQQAAEGWPAEWNTSSLPRSTFTRLIRANVSAWYHRVLKLLNQRHPLPMRATFLLARTLAPLLSTSERITLQGELLGTLGRHEYHWVQNGRNSEDTTRLADLFAQFLHESGGRPMPQGATSEGP